MLFGKQEPRPDPGTVDQGDGIPRHKRDGRPKIFPEGGGKGEYYTRVTTFIDCLEDKSTLSDWKLRMTLKGLSRRPDLMEDYAKIGDPDGHDKWKAKGVAELAMQAAGAGYKAEMGTAIHEATEALDRGEEPNLPPDLLPDVTAYSHAMKQLGVEVEEIELFSVNDDLRCAGTMDRIVRWGDLHVVADVKTGIAYYGKTAMQCAIYSRSLRYDPETYERTPLAGAHNGEGFEGAVDTGTGLFIHVPLGQGTCTVRALDLNQGWEDVHLAARLREVRKRNARKSSIPAVEISVRADGSQAAA